MIMPDGQKMKKKSKNTLTAAYKIQQKFKKLSKIHCTSADVLFLRGSLII